MRNEKLTRVLNILLANGVSGEPAAYAAHDIIAACRELSETVYEKNDFIWFNEGMGESGHGTVVRRTVNGYLVHTYDYEGKAKSYSHSVSLGDIIGLSTPTSADEYFRQRSGNN